MSNKVYEILTEQIIEALEEGHIPWEKPWNGMNFVPKNMVSDKTYRGFNAMLTSFLSMRHGYKTNLWLSYKQVKDMGGEVKKGEKSCPIMYYKMLEKKDASGEVEDTFPLLRYYRVFNLDQTEGIEIPESDEVELIDHTPKEVIDLKVMEYLVDGPKLEEELGDRAYYDGIRDLVMLPELGQFKSIEEYYGTLFHELAHSTGHKTRLKRFGDGPVFFGNTEYAKEELVAELSACFSLSHFGLTDRVIKNSKAYIKGWLKALKSNPKWIVEASSKAQKATEFVLGIDNNKGD